jgi:serine phosphatase RsbU (regulator of sigma subunit)
MPGPATGPATGWSGAPASFADASWDHLDTTSLFDHLLERVADLLGTDTVVVLLLEPEREQLVAYASHGLEEELRQGIRVPLGHGFAGRVAADRAPLVLDAVGPDMSPLLATNGLASALGVPLLARGELIGVMQLGSRSTRRFDARDLATAQAAADRMATAIVSQRAMSERTAALTLQRSLLPSRLPHVDGLELATRFAAATEFGVGGDWYDAFRLPDGDIGFVIGDVAGNGLRAAIVMARLRSVVRAYAVEHRSPARVLDRVDRKFAHFEPDELATVSYARLGPDLGTLTVANAGHLPPVLAVPGGDARLLAVPRDPPICAGNGVERRDLVVDVPPGSTLVMYTDGLVERRHHAIDERLDLLRRTVRADAAEAVAAEVMQALVGLDDVRDDTALLVITRTA